MDEINEREAAKKAAKEKSQASMFFGNIHAHITFGS